jgi:CHAT domain-containing protein/Tfp pilus assembly protein PilF
MIMDDFEQEIDRLNGRVERLFSEAKYEQAFAVAVQACDLIIHQFGDIHPRYAACLHDLAVLLDALGDFDHAEKMYLQSIAVYRDALGEQHPEYANSLNDLALLYKSNGKYAQAELLLRRALRIYAASLGKEHAFYANGLNNLAGLYEEQGKYSKAEPLYIRSLKILEKSVGVDSEGYATGLNNLGYLYESTGAYAKAEDFYLRALEIRRAVLGKEHPDVGDTLNNLGTLYKSLSDYCQSEFFLNQALELRRKVYGEKDTQVAQTLSNLAGLYLTAGRFAESKDFYQTALNIRREILPVEHPAISTTLNNLAGLYVTTGRYADAKPLYLQALRILRATLGDDHLNVARLLNNLAELYRSIGSTDRAESLAQQAFNITHRVLGDQHPEVATGLINLAGFAESKGDLQRAEKLYRAALEILNSTFGENSLESLAAINNLAAHSYTQGKHNGAEQLWLQSLMIARAHWGEAHPDVALGLSNLGVLQYSLGDHAAAEAYLRQALEIYQQILGPAAPEVALALHNLAGPLVALKRVMEALDLQEKSERINDSLMGQVFTIGSEQQRLAYLTTFRGSLNTFLTLIYKYLSGSDPAKQSALELVFRRKAISAEALAVQRDAILGGHYRALDSQLRELTMLRAQIAEKTLKGPGLEELTTHQQRLTEWEEQRETLEAELAGHIPQMNLEKRLRAATLQQVAASLKKGEALVEFCRVEVFNFEAVPARGEPRWQAAHYLAFILLPNKPQAEVHLLDLGEADSIDLEIAAFRNSIIQGGRHLKPARPVLQARKSDGTVLRQRVFDPIHDALKRSRRLFLAPDGDLSQLPFEALPLAGDRCLIDEYEISYLSTGRDLLRFENPASLEPTPALVIADPDFDLRLESTLASKGKPVASRQSEDLEQRGLDFTRLSGTRLEGERIADLLGVQPLLDQNVLERFIKSVKSPRILHIASHGFFLPSPSNTGAEGSLIAQATIGDNDTLRPLGAGAENPLLRSGLALAGANTRLRRGVLPDEAEDGILNAEDVTGLDLLATDLVVLSACDTGLGDVQVGEGVFGLRRAFQVAGAKTLIMSLWKVPDLETQELMEDFYQRLRSGEGRASALRQAQLEIKKKFSNPYYWGAFICQGDPGPLAL